MAPTTPPLINPSLRTNGGDDGAAGALASATSAEKKQGSTTPRGLKVSNNFGLVQARRNPARMAKINGGGGEAEAAGMLPRKKPHGLSPQKKPCGKETFLLRLDRAKATAKHGRTKPIKLEGNPDDRADSGRPKKGLPKTTKAPRVSQEDNGMGELDSEEEEVDSKDNEGGDLDNDDEELNAARNEAMLESTKRDDGAIDRTNKAESIPARLRGAKKLDAARDEAMLVSIPACPCGAKHDSGVKKMSYGR